MIPRVLPSLVALASVLGAACYPVQEHPPVRPRPIASTPPPAEPQATGDIAQQVQEQSAATPAERPGMPVESAPRATESVPVRPAAKPKVADPVKQGPVTAEKAPGRKGYVISPYTSKLILVEGIPSGVVVPDQTCPPSEKKFFRVP